MPGLSSLPADGASDSEGCHGGQGPGSRFPRPLLLGCLPLADVLPGSLCSCPELPEGPPGPLGRDHHTGCASKAKPTRFLSFLLQTSPALGWWGTPSRAPSPVWQAESTADARPSGSPRVMV